jgi:hypothetical protein
VTEGELIASVLSLGVGGVLGVIMFLCYRQDRKATECRLTGLLEQDQKSREANTTVLAELVTLIKRINNGG